MTEKTVIIKSALDARQVAFFVQTAGKFQSDIKIAIDNKSKCKSIMGIIALEMAEGQRANILAEGSDEEAAVNELAAALS